ncbi:MAG: immunoglobulin domain-containing protein [Chthoniobacterales bacterium]
MKTSAPPVSVSRTGQTPVVPTPADPVIVSIGLSQPKSVQERVYLRWSTDSFITSHLISAQGSGTSYAATIPAQPAGTLILYTIITSTVDLSVYSGSGAIDSLVLATTGVFNTVPPTSPTPSPTATPTPTPTATPTPTPDGLPQITQQPADTRARLGGRAKFQVVATGTPPLSYQWSKNGVAISGAHETEIHHAPYGSD